MSSFETLIEEHEALAGVLDELEAGLFAPRPDRVRSHRVLTHFAELLTDHLAREDAEVYPLLMSCHDVATVHVATHFAAQFGALSSDWTMLLDRWHAPPTAIEWPAFVDDTLSMSGRLKRRIAEENDVLYPTALAASIISLRERRAA